MNFIQVLLHMLKNVAIKEISDTQRYKGIENAFTVNVIEQSLRE